MNKYLYLINNKLSPLSNSISNRTKKETQRDGNNHNNKISSPHLIEEDQTMFQSRIHPRGTPTEREERTTLLGNLTRCNTTSMMSQS